MNKTAELVRLWAEYEANHPDAEIEDFCQFFLISEREKHENRGKFGGIVPPDLYSKMAKMTGRLVKLHQTYAMPQLKDCGLRSFDEFLYLNTISNTENPRKTEVIYANFNELSSGLLILDRLKKSGYIQEDEDTTDKRSKRLSITEKGEAVLLDCYEKLKEVNEVFFHAIPDDDIQLCLQLLTPLEVKFSGLWLEHKGKRIGEVKESLGNLDED